MTSIRDTLCEFPNLDRAQKNIQNQANTPPIRFLTNLTTFSAATLMMSAAFFNFDVQAAEIRIYEELQAAITAGGEYSLTTSVNGNSALGTVSGNFSLDGGGFGLSGNNSAGMIIGAGSNVSIANIGSASSSWNGFAKSIVNAGSLSLDNIIFNNNSTKQNGVIDGGVLQNTGIVNEISNSVFDNNYSASQNTSTWGGIIANGKNPGSEAGKNAEIKRIYNTVFSNNYIETLAPSISASHGGIIVNYAKIGTIEKVTFENNTMTAAENSWGGNHGVAIDNQNWAEIGLITDSIFRNNKTFRTGETVYDDERNYHASAGAIDNYNRIGLIKNSLFEGNSAESIASSAGSGAIMNLGVTAGANDGYIGGIENSQFINNHAYSIKNIAYAGGIANGSATGATVMGTIDHITNSLFRGNYVKSDEDFTHGGALSNSGIINKLNYLEFIDNKAISGSERAYGGAMDNSTSGIIGNLDNLKFTSNYAEGKFFGRGGAIYSVGTLGNLNKVVFEGNFVKGDTEQSQGGAAVIKDAGNFTEVSFNNNFVYAKNYQSLGGAMVISGNIGKFSQSNFSENYIKVDNGTARGGGIFLGAGSIAGIENTTFINNYALSGNSATRGGAIYLNGGNMGKIVNSTFSGNYVKGITDSNGGAIYSKVSLDIEANNGNTLFENNKANNISNAIYMEGAEAAPLGLKLGAYNGVLSIKDGIDGQFYNLNITGNTQGTVELLDRVNNVTNLSVNGTTLHIGLKPLEVINYAAGSSVFLKVDVDPETKTSGLIRISGDVSGTSKVIINALNPKLLQSGDKIKFVEAPNDDKLTTSAFEIFRVYGSPNLWAVNQLGNEWYMSMLRDKNPDYDDRLVTSETIGYIGLHSAAIEQTRSLPSNIKNKVAMNKLISSQGVSYEDYYHGYALYNAWVSPIYYTGSNKKPVKIESDIWGVEAGLDVQGDIYNKVGVFASYRKGEFELNGSGKDYYSPVGSELDIKSYIGGLYYRFDRNNGWIFATLYGGKQKAELKTNDGISDSSSATQIGGSIEAGQMFSFAHGLSLEPSLGVFYTQIDYDKMEDHVGKTAKFDKLKYSEIEAGIKLEKTFVRANKSFANVYVKPSVIKPFASGENVTITGLDAKVKTYDPEFLWRGEFGGRYGLTDQLTGYGYINYTKGSDYDATALGIGLNYSW